MTNHTVSPACKWHRFAISLDRDRPGYVCEVHSERGVAGA
jgi:hypothetical protein